jgi:hypothetical protein
MPGSRKLTVTPFDDPGEILNFVEGTAGRDHLLKPNSRGTRMGPEGGLSFLERTVRRVHGHALKGGLDKYVSIETGAQLLHMYRYTKPESRRYQAGHSIIRGAQLRASITWRAFTFLASHPRYPAPT